MTKYTPEEMKEYRKKHPEYADRERRRERGKRIARERLVGEHREEYLRYLSEELIRLGVITVDKQ